MSEQKILRYGVVGSGWIVDEMIAGAQRYPDLQLTAVCSRSPERAAAYAARHHAPYAFTTVEELAACDAVDFVYIASPNRLHAEQAAVCLRHHKHVLCEKPVTAHPRELKALQCLARRQNCLLSEAIMLLFQPQLAVLQQAVAQLGDISTVHFSFAQLSSKYPAYLSGETPNIFNPALETGALQDLGIYCVYPALLLFGEPTAISANASFLHTGADAACTALLHYPDKQVTLSCSKIGQGAAPSEIIGDKGTLTIEAISKLENMTLRLHDTPPEAVWGSEDKSILMGREIHTFAAWIQTGAPPAYAQHEALALDVAACMRRIRSRANIVFPRDADF